MAARPVSSREDMISYVLHASIQHEAKKCRRSFVAVLSHGFLPPRLLALWGSAGVPVFDVWVRFLS